jgi:deazaflavin-dependent oxidoreductase (nitroreductase family)
MDISEFNSAVVAEFRDNRGQVGGRYEGVPILLLHTAGRRTGSPRVNPLVYRPHKGAYVVFATYAGSPIEPEWCRNLLAAPKAMVEIGSESVDVTARVAEGDERSALWAAQVADYPRFAEYEQRAGREIPVVVLTP